MFHHVLLLTGSLHYVNLTVAQMLHHFAGARDGLANGSHRFLHHLFDGVLEQHTAGSGRFLAVFGELIHLLRSTKAPT